MHRKQIECLSIQPSTCPSIMLKQCHVRTNALTKRVLTSDIRLTFRNARRGAENRLPIVAANQVIHRAEVAA